MPKSSLPWNLLEGPFAKAGQGKNGFGLYHYKRIPFGLCNAAAAFQVFFGEVGCLEDITDLARAIRRQLSSTELGGCD